MHTHHSLVLRLPLFDQQVDKYDDPNTAVNKLMLALTSMGFELNFPANRLKQVHYKP